MVRLSATSSSAGIRGVDGQISAPSTTTTTTTTTTSPPLLPPAAAAAGGNGNTNNNNDKSDLPQCDWEEDAIDTKPIPMDSSLFAGGTRDLSLIGLQAFVLGSVFAAGIAGTSVAAAHDSTWWRLPAFATSLALFHFLEYYTTARYNTPAVRAESFLLFNNGRAYNTAHGCAALELVLSRVLPRYGQAFVNPGTVAVGVVLVVVGQVVRSLAMAQAGPSFNHVIAREHKDTHKLVTHGLYAIFRHPSYFGFFYWAVGTQFLVGNKVCLVGYIAVLWHFFNKRIQGEEKFLVSFFGDKYIEYREKTGTKIPFIR